MKIEIGQEAPNFSLYNTQKEIVNLSDLKGQNVVLLFFPLAFTSVCTTEMCSVRDDINSYRNLNATVFGISTDSLFTLAQFKTEQNLNFELLSDYNKQTARDYNSIYEEFKFNMNGVCKRSAFVIDKNGIVQYEEVLENTVEVPNLNSIKSTLENLN